MEPWRGKKSLHLYPESQKKRRIGWGVGMLRTFGKTGKMTYVIRVSMGL